MIGSSNQRGMSLLLLVIAMTVFAGVAMGIVTLLRPRHESYPYQVQSYQAYALAHAGVEFAIQLAKDNSDTGDPYSFANHPEYYIPIDGTYKAYKFGNGWFALTYARGCKFAVGPQDALLSKGCLTQPASDGTCAGPSREIRLAVFSQYSVMPGDLFVGSAITRTPYSNAGYSGDRIEFDWCDPELLLGDPNKIATYVNYGSWPAYEADYSDTMRIAAYSDNGQPIYLARFALDTYPDVRNPIYWKYDIACGVPQNNTYAGSNAICHTSGGSPNYTPVADTYNGVSSFYYPSVGSTARVGAGGTLTSTWNGQTTPVNDTQLFKIAWNTSSNNRSNGVYNAAAGGYVNSDNANRPQKPINVYTNIKPNPCDGSDQAHCPSYNPIYTSCSSGPPWADAMCQFYQEGKCWDETVSPLATTYWGPNNPVPSKYLFYCSGGSGLNPVNAFNGNGRFMLDTLGPLPIDLNNGVRFWIQVKHQPYGPSGPQGSVRTWNYKFRITNATPRCTISPSNPLCVCNMAYVGGGSCNSQVSCDPASPVCGW